MEDIITKYDYLHGDNTMESAIVDDLERSDQRFAPGLTLDGLKKIISTYVRTVCVQPFANRNASGYYMCKAALESIISVMKACKSEHNVITKEQCQELLFDLILDFITKGQGSTHYQLVHNDLTDALSMGKFIKSLRGEKLKRLLHAIKQQKFVQEADIDIDEYGRIYQRAIGYLVDSALGDDEEEGKHKDPEIQCEFLDVYIFFMTQATKNPVEMAHNLGYCQYQIKHKYGSEPYKGCGNVDLYKRHLNDVKTVLSDKNFPRCKRESEFGDDAVKDILFGISKDVDLQKALWKDVNELSTYLVTCSNTAKLTPQLSRFRTFVNKTDEKILQDAGMFEHWATKCIEVLNKVKDSQSLNYLSSQIEDMMEKANPVAAHQKYWLSILKGLLHHPTKALARNVRYLLEWSKMKKHWKWKTNIDEAKMIVRLAKEADLPKEKDKDRENEDTAGHYGKAIKELFEQLQLVKVHHSVVPDLALLIISTMEKRSELLNRKIAEELCDLFDYTRNQNLIPDLLKRFSVLYFDADYPWEGWTVRAGVNVLQALVEGYKDGKTIPQEVNDLIISMLNFAMAEDTERIDFESRDLSFYGKAISAILVKFVSVHCESGTENILSPIIPSILTLTEADEEETLTYVCTSATSTISSKAPKLLAVKGDFDRVIQRYLDTGDVHVLGSLYNLYPHNTGAMAKRFQEFMITLGINKENTHTILGMIYLISQRQPEIFTKENIKAMSAFLRDQGDQILVLMVWEKIAVKNPDLFLDQMNRLLTDKEIPLSGTHFMQGILSSVAVKHKKYLEPVLKYLIEKSKDEDQIQVLSVFYGLRKLADKYGPDPFKPYRKYLDQLKKSGVSFTNDAVSSLIDVLENRSLETLSSDVKQVKEDVVELDERVTGAEIVIGGVVQQVEKHEEEIKDVKDDVVKVNKRVDDVEEEMEEVKEKVEEIDMKTMSNAPTWSRDVTKLLNLPSDHDWRLLASRLGYTNDDIRAWATQSDPCMALLSEWYATHKTREATSAVLNALQEMNRLDAGVIVENAMKVAEDVIEDEEFEYPSPPPVFLSYQWGHQNEVKLLRQHLEMAGYECWMDVGQMGGGDKLFEKIDAGIRGAKVVICCVSEKYSKSPNCNREVNLAVNLRKPMIPLQMEKLEWPPAGSMGPIFSEYLYIRFYSGGGTNGNKYWADAKFQELLMQLQFNSVMPDEKLIKPEYKNWWIPVAEEIVIKQDEKKGIKGEKKDIKNPEKKEKDISPDVFLSYQWGKQKQIQALYQRLTGLGFSCWMDIHQMGGGDSLYDKIDRGVRGCKVIVSSVTQKYALSANCRREVSLADALKKPIIPILLEEITWPPSGPMSMVFTQLLYISFCKNPDIQMKWTGKEFDELISKLKGFMPHESQETKTPNKSTPTKMPNKTNVESAENKSNRTKDDDKAKGGPKTSNEVVKPTGTQGDKTPTEKKTPVVRQKSDVKNSSTVTDGQKKPNNESNKTTVEPKPAKSNKTLSGTKDDKNNTEKKSPMVKHETTHQTNGPATQRQSKPKDENKPASEKKSSTCNIL